MIGKIITTKSNKAEKLVKTVFERFSFTNLEDDELIRKPRIYVPDFVFEFEENKYCVVVEIQFSVYFLGHILEDFDKLLKKEKKFGIIVILDKVPKEYKKLIKEEYNIDIYDISNILYLIYDDANLQNEFNSIIDFPLDSITPQKIDKEAIIRVCLLHNMGNIVKIPEDFSQDKGFIKTRKKYFEKYGTNDYEINLEIGKKEGLNEKEIEILDGKRSRKNEETLKSNSYERKICAYSNQRVAPNGIVSIKERLEDAKVRYKDKPLSVWSNEEKANYLIECSLEIEKQIMEYCKISPEKINDELIEKYIEELREYEIIVRK